MLSKERENELSELADFIANQYCPKGIIDPTIIAKAKQISYCYGQYILICCQKYFSYSAAHLHTHLGNNKNHILPISYLCTHN